MSAPARRGPLVLLSAGLCLTALCAWLEARSVLGPALRSDGPLAALVALRFEGQGKVVPPALYLAVRSRRRLDLMLLPPFARVAEEASGRTLAEVYGRRFLESKDEKAAGRAMGDAALGLLRATAPPASPLAEPLRLSLELGPSARPADPVEVKSRLAAWASDPLLWLRLAAALSRHSTLEGLGRYDSLLLARRLAGTRAADIRLWRLPEPGLVAAALARVLGGAGDPPIEGTPTLEVLNASGVDGLALRATKILRWSRLDVVHYGDGAGPEPRVRFVDRSGRPAAAAAAAEALGCPEADIVTSWESEPPASVTVVLGRDFARCARLK